MPPKVDPTLTAVMCDGMGWFRSVDYKRALLVYDKIYYLLPRESALFTDVTGDEGTIVFPSTTSGMPAGFEITHFEPNRETRTLAVEAAKLDVADESFVQAVAAIPESERLYTWRAVNADGDVGSGKTLGLAPGDQALAHGILLNKFLLAAAELGSVPITGKPYIQELLSAKYALASRAVAAKLPQLAGEAPAEPSARHQAVLDGLVGAIVSDEELERRSEAEIVEFKTRQRALFESFSLSARRLVARVRSLPGTKPFDRELEDLIATDLWKEKREIEDALSAAWRSFFGSAAKSATGALVAIGLAPLVSLPTLTVGAVLAAVGAAAPWLVEQAVDLLEKRKDASGHGVYYLMKFAES